MGDRAKSGVRLFFHPGHARMLLITNTRSKNMDFYPKMCMIISYLVKNFQKLAIYFHRDKLWINPKARQFKHRTHDVYDRKGVNTKVPKASFFFNMLRGGKIREVCAIGFRTHDMYERKGT